jgi:hypothetical protein
LYGYETLPLTLKEEHSLRVFENKVPRRIFGLKETGGRRKLHIEELHRFNQYCSLAVMMMIKLRKMRWTGM